jgi:O-antigen ligase
MGGFERLRAFALWPQHISLYSVIMVGVLICGVLLGRHRYLYVSGIFALLVCTYLTGYRTAWIGVTLLIGLIIMVAVRSGLAKFVALLVALSLLGASGIIVRSLARYAHEDEAISVDVLDAVTSGRITTDSIALDRYLRGNPAEWLFGIGGVYSSIEATLEQGRVGYEVHSDLLATLIECGILGLLGYLFFNIIIAWILLRVMRYLPTQHASRTFVAVGFACFIVFTIMGMAGTLYTNVFVGWYYYAFIGFALAQLKSANPPLVPVVSGSDVIACEPSASRMVHDKREH